MITKLFIDPHAAETTMLRAAGPQRVYAKMSATAAREKAMGTPKASRKKREANIRRGYISRAIGCHLVIRTQRRRLPPAWKKPRPSNL